MNSSPKGSFTATFPWDPSNEALNELIGDPSAEVFLYAPRDLSWRERLVNWLLRRSWPDEVIYAGRVTSVGVTEHVNPPDVVTVTVTATGHMKISDG